MTKIITYILIGFLFVSSCQLETDKMHYMYPQDHTISTIDGKPKDSLTFYFPIVIKKDNQQFSTGLDTFRLNLFSSALYAAREPILYNYYLGHDIYRFLWQRSFHRPVVFSLYKDGNNVWLITKALNKQPEFMELIYFTPPTVLPNGEIDTIALNKTNGGKSTKKADRKASIVVNELRHLSNKEWNEFEKIINDYSFWTTKSFIESDGLDGSRWTIEGHVKNNYWFVSRWSPKDNLRKAGEYLIGKSGLKEEIY